MRGYIKMHAFQNNNRIAKVRQVGVRAYLATVAPTNVLATIHQLITEMKTESVRLGISAMGDAGSTERDCVNSLSARVSLLCGKEGQIYIDQLRIIWVH